MFTSLLLLDPATKSNLQLLRISRCEMLIPVIGIGYSDSSSLNGDSRLVKAFSFLIFRATTMWESDASISHTEAVWAPWHGAA